MTDRQKLTGERNRNLRKIQTLKKRNRLILGELFLIDQAIRPMVPLVQRRKIDGLIQEMLDFGDFKLTFDKDDWSAIAKKINDHRFRIDGSLWMGRVVKRYWEEKED